jgi:UDP:flavonoid glycosyltransferase YjiC (YdhE family)
MRCLFLVNGLGLGNSTRCHGVIEQLAEQGWEIHVLTSGNGLSYFEGKEGIASVSGMDSLFYSGSGAGISGWSTVRSLGALVSRARAKRRQLADRLRELKPQVAVIDSEYALAPLRHRRIPVIGLNTSEVVVTGYFKHRRGARDIHSHFWFVELMDYLFHRCFCDLVLSPFPIRIPTRHPRFKRIGLVVRRAVSEIASHSPRVHCPPSQVRNVVFMLSGSVHASEIPFKRYALPFKVNVVGRAGDAVRNVTFHGRTTSNIGLMAAADALVINGGYSALSEAFALRKPTFVIPVPGHAEQYVNACLARDLGLGFVATENNVLEQLLKMRRLNQWVGLGPQPPVFEIGGAEEAARAIVAFASRKHIPRAAFAEASDLALGRSSL